MAISPDQQVALLNYLMREVIAPQLPPGVGATLFLFPMRKDPNTPTSQSIISYISNASRADMADAMNKLLERWKVQAQEKNEPPKLTPPRDIVESQLPPKKETP